jgi:hypothetical protein
MRHGPNSDDTVIDYGPALSQLIERMVEQIARDCLLPLDH